MERFKIIIAIALLPLSGCVVMTRKDFYLLQYENRMLGHMEGLATCGKIMSNADENSREFRIDEMDGLSQAAGEQVRDKFRPSEIYSFPIQEN